MARYRNIGQFRRALSGAIQGRHNPPKLTYPDGSVLTFESVDEFLDFRKKAGLTEAPAAPAAPVKKKKKKKKKKTPSPVESFGGGRSTGFFGSGRAPQGAGAALMESYGGKKKKVPSRGYTLGPYGRIVRSVGGFRALCPNIDLDSVVPPQGVTKSEFVLKKLGLTPAKEKRVAALMDGEGVLQKTRRASYALRTYNSGVTVADYKKIERSPEGDKIKNASLAAAQARARAILFEEAGIACPINLEAIENPRNGFYAIPPNNGVRIPYGHDPTVANWTSYPQYSYDMYYRANPAKKRKSRKRRTTRRRR